jgi:Lon protease-like protein
MSDESSAAGNVGGPVRLFPLPNLVIYPQVLQPLHVFEPRYRQMTADALDGDRQVAVVLLRPGWEADYADRPSVHAVACLGRIVAEQRLEDGRFHILLRGQSRIRLGEEVDVGKLYRCARCELVEETEGLQPRAERKLRRQLSRLVPDWFGGAGPALAQFRKLLKSPQRLGVLCDIVAFALPLAIEFKQELLETADVEQRARQLLNHLETNQPPKEATSSQRKFPPDFSEN